MEKKNKTGSTISDITYDKPVWLETTTLNFLPGEEIRVTVRETGNREDLFSDIVTIGQDGKALILVNIEEDGSIDAKMTSKLTAQAKSTFDNTKSEEVPLNIHNTIKDVVQFVPGTTDPLNTDSNKHGANNSYWKGNDDNFWAKVTELKPQFLDMHIDIENNFFSWSGDNNTHERNHAAERLFDLLMRLYPNWANKEVHFHFIGHSHGGNVINQFTNLIASEETISRSEFLREKGYTLFPEDWKIKSITYLSTPFFKDKHQLNHKKLHKDCKIINVHNEYDITQRFVADFSLLNLEIFINNLNSANFTQGQEKLEDVDTNAFKHLYNFVINNHTEGPFLWRETSKALLGISLILKEIIKYIKYLDIEKVSLEKERKEIADLFISINKWVKKSAKKFDNNRRDRKGGYGRSEYLEDLNMTEGIAAINGILKVENNGTSIFMKNKIKDSYLLKILAKIFKENSGLTDTIDNTSWNPKEQTKGIKITSIPITDKDIYDSRNKKKEFESFAKGVEDALKNKNLEEVLMRLFSQFISPNTISTLTWVLKGIEGLLYDNLFYKSKLEKQLELMGDNIDWYNSFIKEYNKKLVAKKDKKEYSEVLNRPGSIPYFAMVSHSLSHTKFWPGTEEELRNAFSSGENPGYKE